MFSIIDTSQSFKSAPKIEPSALEYPDPHSPLIGSISRHSHTTASKPYVSRPLRLGAPAADALPKRKSIIVVATKANPVVAFTEDTNDCCCVIIVSFDLHTQKTACTIQNSLCRSRQPLLVLVVLVMSRLRRHSQKKVVLRKRWWWWSSSLSVRFGRYSRLSKRDDDTDLFCVAKKGNDQKYLSQRKRQKKETKRERKKVLANFFVYSLFRGLLV